MIETKQLDEIWRNHGDRLVLIARSMGEPGFSGLAEDAVQEAFVRLAVQAKLPHDPLAWLVRTTRNQLIDWHRSASRRKRRENTTQHDDWFAESADCSIDRLDAAEVTATLRTLPTPEREVIVMKIWGDMTFAVIADALGLSRASAHRAFERGMTLLKQKYNPQQLSVKLQCHKLR
ncbi:RNA polymerase sigma factor [Novipirellula artificiosorum]|uniref:RNA polymerase sigma factor n=1 Tax=Novipirellula artificiosorum TaxID=2528016 RepID=UPI0018CEB997|nr:sigma-70 family RNA polymerase sigma factor [Novipirellula artificiosorum]